MQRSGRLGRGTGFICVTFALLTTFGMSAHQWSRLRGGGLSNPDTYMRLVRLRDMLDSGTTLHSVARDGSGDGTVLHWSHLIDSLLCLLAVPFRLFLDTNDALHAAALIFGPLNIAALAFAVIWAVAPFTGRGWLWLGAVLVALSPAIVGYGIVGVVHHHVAIVLVAVSCWGWAARLITGDVRHGAALALGAWAGLGVWLTPETVPLTMMAFGVLWLAWVAGPNDDERTRSIGVAGATFAVVTALALLADPPAGGIEAVEIDRLSLLFAGLAAAVAALSVGLSYTRPWSSSRAGRCLALCLIGSVCAVIWAATFRASVFRSDILVNDQRALMFDAIAEMLPVTDVFGGLHFLLTGALAALVATAWAIRARSIVLAYVALCIVALLVMGSAHLRFAAYPEAAGAIALPLVLAFVGDATRRWHPIGQSFTRMALILLFIQVPFLGQMAAATGGLGTSTAMLLPACRIADAAGMLRAHPDAVVLADVSDTPEILYRTRSRTVGSLYHRDIAAFSRLRAAWRAAPSNTVPAEIDEAEVSLILGCRTPARSRLVDDLSTATLSDQVRTGNPPAWLAQIDEVPSSGQVLYEVVRHTKPSTLAEARR